MMTAMTDLDLLAHQAAERAACPQAVRGRVSRTSDLTWWALRVPAFVALTLAVHVLADLAGAVAGS